MNSVFIEESKIYELSDIDWILNRFLNCTTSDNGKKKDAFYECYDISSSFDIETSSFYQDGEKKSIMYIWQLGIGGYVIMGRTWDEFKIAMEKISTIMDTNVKKRFVIYVHNLSFEFQYIRKLFDWDKIFSLDIRKPVSAVTTTGIEFKCSYILSGYSLANLSNQCLKYPVKKMVGDLDYTLLRTHKTKLSDTELKYCENDVRVVMSYIQEKMEREDGLAKLLITKTSYVRRYARKNCFEDFIKYSDLMNTLKLTLDDYKQSKKAFQGGFTHASKHNCNKVFTNVRSCDFASSYPAVMLSEKFPMSRLVDIEIDSIQQLFKISSEYCIITDVTFTGLVLKQDVYDTPLSVSKCDKISKPIIDNGRVIMCESLTTTVTDLDIMIFSKTYDWDTITFTHSKASKKGYLPKKLILAILSLYSDKTVLKGVQGKEVEYLSGKENLNATYGMMVTDIDRDDIIYDSDDWFTKEVSISSLLERYNESKSRFLYYPWGVFITAYARKNLWTGILSCGKDYLYSDTDSVKVTNFENHIEYFNSYNESIKSKLLEMTKYYDIDESLLHPKNQKGEEKWIGVWDTDDGFYTRFKTLGAKRYMYEYESDGVLKTTMTVSGVRKKDAIEYMTKTFGEDLFPHFTDGLIIPKGSAGKLTHTYIDVEINGTIVDYQDNISEYHEDSCVHMEEASYELTMSEEYKSLLYSIETLTDTSVIEYNK